MSNDALMAYEKERILVSYYVGNHKLMSMVSPIIEGEYFDPRLSKVINWSKQYFQQYKEPPKFHQVEIETGIKLVEEVQNIVDKAEIDWAATELESICKNKAVESALLKSIKLLDENKHSEIIAGLKTAVSVGLTRDLGITNVFDDPRQSLKLMLEQNPLISTGWPDVDERIGGGISRGELVLFLANSGGGKSINKLNLGLNLLLQGFNGAYASLEMGQDVVQKRALAMMTGIGTHNLYSEIDLVEQRLLQNAVNRGQLAVKRFPENRTNVGHLKAWLDSLYETNGFKPDFIIVDYIDITGSLSKTSGDNMFVKDKYVTEEVRSLGYDYNAIMISSSQLGRDAIDAEKLNQAHTQGGMSKINTSDVCIAIQQTDIMKAAGELRYTYLKVRNGDGTGMSTMMSWDPISLRVTSKQQAPAVKQLITSRKSSVDSLIKTLNDRK